MVSTAKPQDIQRFRDSITDGLPAPEAATVLVHAYRWGWGLAGGLAAAMRADLAKAGRG